MTGKYPGTIRINMAVVDVREVAQAHLNAVKIDAAANQRFLLSNKSYWF